MCGVFGAIGEVEAIDAGLVAAALQHRGPDAHGSARLDDALLVHTRLRVIDLSEAAAQPLAGCAPSPSPSTSMATTGASDGGASVHLVFNGEIYNHRALRVELEARGHRFRSHTDSECIVHGYEEWGAGVVERLDGMFAIGVWDPRARTLLLARDRTGKKPVYYTVSPDGQRLRFASEVKALVAADPALGGPGAVDPAALPMLLSFGYVPAPATMYRGVQALAPATRIVWRPGHAAVPETYWRPTFLDPPIDVSFDEAKAEVRRLVVAAVERRLEADVPLGAFLSGGIDSTIVVGVMARLLGRKVRTFSIGFAEDPAFDESAAARRTAALFGAEHTGFQLGPPSVELLEELVRLHDGPHADSSAIPTYTVAKLTRQHVTVALSGDGGDELFAGYLRFLAAEAAERVPSVVRGLAARGAGLLPDGLPVHSLGARARRFLGAAGLPIADRVARWSSSFAFGLGALLRPELARTLDLDGPMRWQRSFFAPEETRGSTLAQLLEHNFRTYLAWDLQTKVDRTTAGVGLEVRSPLLDTALVEYAGRLPDRFRRRGTRTKHVLRAAFADLIPDEIARRPKRGFGVPLARWLRGDLRPYLVETLGGGARIHHLLQRSTVQTLVDDHLAGRADRSAQLYTLLTLEVWLRQLASTSTSSSAATCTTAPSARAS